MGQLNWKRLVLGGLVAGLVIDASEWFVNGFVFGGEWASVMQSLNRSPTFSVKQIVALNLWGFLTGTTMMWLYASLRPRFGAGPRTAVVAGVAMWWMSYALGGSFPVVTHIFPLQLAAITVLIGLVEAVVAALAGAAIYKEVNQPLSRAAAA